MLGLTHARHSNSYFAVVEQLTRTGNIEDTPKATLQVSQAPPPEREPSDKSSQTSSPPPNARRGVYTPPSPTQAQSQGFKSVNIVPPMEQVREPSREPFRSPPSTPVEKPSGVRFSDRTPTARPSPGRTFSTMELSTIDQKWGRLFDNEGRPTQRLGQFLRGLANHIVSLEEWCYWIFTNVKQIDHFQPKKSIVVTPSKMALYYSRHALDHEPNPLVCMCSILRKINVLC